MAITANGQNKNLNIYYTNCGSIFNKISELKTISKLYECHVLCLTETHLSNELLDAEILIENYRCFRGDRQDGRDKGGSMIYVHNNISCIKINSFDPHDSLAVLIDLHVSNSLLHACTDLNQLHITIIC